MFLALALSLFTTPVLASGFLYDYPYLKDQGHLETALFKQRCVDVLSQHKEASLSAEEIEEILRLDGVNATSGSELRAVVQRALDNLAAIENPTQLALAKRWEQFALAISRHYGERSWRSSRMFGKKKEIVYVGASGHSLVITKDALVFKGLITVDDLRGARWNSDYRMLDRIL